MEDLNVKMEKREEIFSKIAKKTFDVIVIGGGASGFGSAVCSAYNGHKTLLLEQFDFAKGTSSRSTKILHGGLRYLAQGHIHLVYEALHEKMLTYQNAPHLGRSLDFVIPCSNLFQQLFYGVGAKVYDLLAGFNLKYLSKLIGRETCNKMLPKIAVNHTRYGVVYNDGQFDDARMVISLMKTLEKFDGNALNYAKVIDFIKENDEIKGVKFQDTLTGNEYEIYANCVINASGIFSDKTKYLDHKASQSSTLTLAQGVHIVVSNNIYKSKSAVIVPKTSDGRVLFFIPWSNNKVIIGTTDTKVLEAVPEPRAFQEEIDFIINNANEYLATKITKEDIKSVYAGIRPLPKADKNSAAISREEVITISPSGLISVIGGKWTTYRKMGEKVISFAVKNKKITHADKSTKHLKLADYLSENELMNVPPIYKVYGSRYYGALKHMSGVNNILHSKLEITEAMVEYAVMYEKACRVEDVLARRTRCLFLDYQASIEVCVEVAEIMRKILHKDEAWKNQEIENFKQIAENYNINNFKV